MNNLAWLQEWYQSMCDGLWEHSFGVRIDTLDNPGWSIEIGLHGVDIEASRLPVERKGEDDWFICWVKEDKFEGHGGARNLDDMINVFRNALATHDVSPAPSNTAAHR
jgi:hypothetical protein